MNTIRFDSSEPGLVAKVGSVRDSSIFRGPVSRGAAIANHNLPEIRTFPRAVLQPFAGRREFAFRPAIA